MACALSSAPLVLPTLVATFAVAMLFACAPAPVAAEVWSEVPGVNQRDRPVAVWANGQLILIGGGGNAPDYNQVWTLDLVAPPVWRRASIGGTPPPELHGHSAIYDPIGNRVLVFGGETLAESAVSGLWQLALGTSPVWTQLTPAGPLPDARRGHAALYDPVRQRMLVFGGVDAGGLQRNDTWELSLSGPLVWAPLAVSGTPPAPRSRMAAIYHPAGDRVLIWGGESSTLPLGDLWELALAGTPAWTALSPAGTAPSAREGGVAVFDPSGDRMIVSGGQATSSVPRDSWALALSGPLAWSQLPTGGEAAPRQLDAASIYDPGADRMIVFGGASNEVWSLALGADPAWSEIRPSNATPGWRLSHAAIYDAGRVRMLVIGGASDSGSPDVWSLDLVSAPAWSRLSMPGAPPNPRDAFYDGARDRVLVHAWSLAGASEIWELSLPEPAWSQLAPTGPPPGAHYETSGIFDPLRNRIIFYGVPAASSVAEVWDLSLSGTPAWHPLATSGPLPPPRSGQSVVYDSLNDRMILWGGVDSNGNELNDLWQLELAVVPTWSQLFPAAMPGRRAYASAIYDPVRYRMVTFGGSRFQSTFADTRYLGLAGIPVWSLGPTLSNGARAHHSAVYDPVHDRMVVFGGTGVGGGPLDDTWMLTWGTPLAVDPPEQERAIGLSPAHPNPAQDGATLHLVAERESHARVQIFDLTGRRVRTLLDAPVAAGKTQLRWDLRTEEGARVPPGIYQVTATTAAARFTRRIVVLH